MASIESAVIGVLRGTRRARPAQIGMVNFFHFWKHQPVPGAINVAWIKDLRVQQFAAMGYHEDYLHQAQRYLETDRAKFESCNAFVAPTATFAGEVMRWYGGERPFCLFANYPSRIRLPKDATQRKEIVYVDNASTVFQEELYRNLIVLFEQLHDLSGYSGVIVSTNFRDDAEALPHRPGTMKFVNKRDYDNLSEYGCLVNLTNFRGAAESLPRKLLLYLHCGMKPLIHGTFAESIQFCRRNGVIPAIYWGWKEAAETLNERPAMRIDREKFCIEERIGNLVSYLQKMGGV